MAILLYVIFVANNSFLHYWVPSSTIDKACFKVVIPPQVRVHLAILLDPDENFLDVCLESLLGKDWILSGHLHGPTTSASHT